MASCNTQTSFFKVANANTAGMTQASAGQVANEGGNASSRFLPRKTIINIVANMFRNKVAGA